LQEGRDQGPSNIPIQSTRKYPDSINPQIAMNNTVNTLIAFVIVLVALSSLLQILMNSVKNAGSFKWSTYKTFLTNMYRELLSDDLDPEIRSTMEAELGKHTDAKDSNSAGNPKIHSVSGRLRQFHTKISLLGATLSESLTELHKVQAELSAQPDIKKAEYLKKYLAENLPTLKSWSQTLTGLRIKSLLGTFAKYDNARQKALNDAALKSDEAASKHPEFGEVVMGAVQSLRDIETRIAEFLAAASDKADAAANAVEDVLVSGLARVEAFEQRVKTLSQNFDARMDSLVTEAQQGYAARVGKHCFWWGLALCLLANADAVSIYQSLSDDPKLRTSVIENMESYTNQPVVQSYAVSIDQLNTDATSIKALIGKTNLTEAKAELASFSKGYTAVVETMEKAARDISKDDDDATDLPFHYKKPLESLSAIDTDVNTTNAPAARVHLDAAIAQLVRDNVALNSYAVRIKAESLTKTELPLGWGGERNPSSTCLGWLSKILGILLMAYLISFGSGFWNDMLKSLLGVRNVLQKTSESGATPTPTTTPPAPKPGGQKTP
jgi:hypothetical protein